MKKTKIKRGDLFECYFPSCKDEGVRIRASRERYICRKNVKGWIHTSDTGDAVSEKHCTRLATKKQVDLLLTGVYDYLLASYALLPELAGKNVMDFIEHCRRCVSDKFKDNTIFLFSRMEDSETFLNLIKGMANDKTKK